MGGANGTFSIFQLGSHANLTSAGTGDRCACLPFIVCRVGMLSTKSL